uniref:uncharacterized protein LOC124065053 n=1 Tax=Scatophagus argus TaxID=75038 RepID=UPI001ED7D8F2|nr:uncharacterized protein LOC124065053 [Scatophagus argus]
MKLFTCCLFLLFGVVITAPLRVRRENVLNFLNDALGTTTEKTITTTIKAYRHPPSKLLSEQDSEDISEAKSTEDLDTNGFTDPDSHETIIPKDMEKDKSPSLRKTDNKRPMDMSSQLFQDQGSREYRGPHREHQASKERIDLNSEEGVAVDAQKAEHSPGKQVIRSSRDQADDSAGLDLILQRKATPGRVNELNGMLAPGRSRELLDWDSLENNNGRPAPQDVDYDDTREFISSETYPAAPPEHMSVPAKCRASC